MHPYIPNTEAEQAELLATLGLSAMDELFAEIPEALRLRRPLDLPAPLCEYDLMRHMKDLAAQNAGADTHVCFAGGGVYDHYIPSVVGHLAGRQEFYTAYTPYQAEMSQGTLQAIFEYQTMIARITGMDVSNASMYDGATACAEALLMAQGIHGGMELVLAASLNPEALRTCATYARFRGLTLRTAAMDPVTGGVDLVALRAALSEKTAAVLVQSPNYYGVIEELAEIGTLAKQAGAVFIVSADPLSLALLESPGALGADIAVGEGQALGNPMSFGGPGFGFFACKKAYQRKLPGRIVGRTEDAQGRRGFVLTLQAREQHIRRESATSNICSNQALCALRAAIYMAAMGEAGMRSAASLSAQNARALHDALIGTGRFSARYGGSFFKEFAVTVDGDAAKLRADLLRHGYLAGTLLSDNGLLLAATEKRTSAEIESFVETAVKLL